MSTYNKEKEINTAIVQQAEADAPKSGFNYKQFYVAPIDERGNIRTDNVNADGSIATDKTINAVIDTPASSYYGFYYDGDGVPPNGYPAGFGTVFLPPMWTKEIISYEQISYPTDYSVMMV
jgi:hypothetical protein